ncbi:DUF2179 domain-containing protein [Tumebacillus avium]|uniref:UPF0316 protein CBW65_01260 n=1 Tax=Tumebacillus avium TaxID=1903704 RepID=A0A1Y0ITU6_9BACL|nr:DUF2179 domain-containing protein [Tumebacillus avium]
MGLLLIFGIQILYVSFFTIRMILLLKGMRTAASILAMGEVFVYVSGLSLVLDRLDDPLNLLCYCLGYGCGVIVGSKIEERLALGYLTVQIVIDSLHDTLPQRLREQGYGVTSWHAEGRDGHRLMMNVLTKRRNHRKLLAYLEQNDTKAFVISYEPTHFRGGFWASLVK